MLCVQSHPFQPCFLKCEIKFIYILTFRAMIVELTCEKLQIQNKTSDIQLPEHIKVWKTAKKMEWLDRFVEPVVDTIMNTYKAPDRSDVEIPVLYKGGLYMLKLPASSRGKPVDVNINGK
jgi:hypothetical protein